MNININQNLPIDQTKDGITSYYQKKWFDSEENLEKEERKHTRTRQLLTIEKRRKQGGPDIFVMQEDDNPRLKEYEEKFTEMNQNIMCLREENDELRANEHDKKMVSADRGQDIDMKMSTNKENLTIIQYESSIKQLTTDNELLTKKLSVAEFDKMKNYIQL